MSDILISNPNPPLDELMHYGVKGMKWGVRRTDAQLGNARSKSLAEKADKYVAKRDARIQKYAERKVRKGTADRAIKFKEFNNRRMQAARIKQGVKERSDRFDKLVEKEMKKDPSFNPKTMSKSEKEYLQRKATNRIIASNQFQRTLKNQAVDRSVKYAAQEIKDKKKFTSKEDELLINVGSWAASTFIKGRISKANYNSVHSQLAVRNIEARNRKIQALKREQERQRKASS